MRTCPPGRTPRPSFAPRVLVACNWGGNSAGSPGMADGHHRLDFVVVGHSQRRPGLAPVEARHAVDDQAHRRPLQRQVLEGRSGVEGVHGIRPAIPREDLVREHHDQHRRAVAPGLVRLHQQPEEGRPVRRIAVGIQEPPLLFVVRRRRPAAASNSRINSALSSGSPFIERGDQRLTNSLSMGYSGVRWRFHREGWP